MESLEKTHLKNLDNYSKILDILIEIYLKNKNQEFVNIKTKFDIELCNIINKNLDKYVIDTQNFLNVSKNDIILSNTLKNHISDFKKLILVIHNIKNNNKDYVINFIRCHIEDNNKLIQELNNLPSPPKLIKKKIKTSIKKFV